jgi:hypothetical protein
VLEVAVAARVEPMFRPEHLADASEGVAKLADQPARVVACALDFGVERRAPCLGTCDDRARDILFGLRLREPSRRLRALFEHELIASFSQRGGGSAERLTGSGASGGGFNVFAFEFVNERLRASNRLARLASFVAKHFRLADRLPELGRLREFGHEIERDACHQSL